MTDQPEYEVGFQKPPKGSQWQPGQSGNPNGRPKKIKDFDKLIDMELSKDLRITEGGLQVTLTKREVIIKTLVNDALKGDLRAMKMVLPFIVKHHAVEGFQPNNADREALYQLINQFESTDATQTQETGNG